MTRGNAGSTSGSLLNDRRGTTGENNPSGVTAATGLVVKLNGLGPGRSAVKPCGLCRL